MPSYFRVVYHQKWPRTHLALKITHSASTSYTKTQYNNQCKVGLMSGGFCTVLTTRGEPNVIIGPVADRDGGSAWTADAQ